MSRNSQGALVKSGAAIYAGAAAIGAIEAAIPGGPDFSAVPGIAALVLAPLIWRFGARVPRDVLFAIGPFGALMIALAVGTSPGAGDAAILYVWPILWVGSFYGRRQLAFTVVTIAAAHAGALLALPDGNVDRWCDVAVTVTILAGVVHRLAAGNARLVARLTAESRVDPLTGLLNRRGLAERFEAEVARALREERPLAVVAIDIDHFKRINDSYGHDAGDRALTWLASVLCEQTRGSDIIARTGGEEFLVVLPGADRANASEFAERLRHAVTTGDAPIALTISAGVAAERMPSSPYALTQAADGALLDAKRDGRDRVAYAT